VGVVLTVDALELTDTGHDKTGLRIERADALIYERDNELLSSVG
jgi:hypothetical protein